MPWIVGGMLVGLGTEFLLRRYAPEMKPWVRGLLGFGAAFAAAFVVSFTLSFWVPFWDAFWKAFKAAR
ncbi:MAG TPA: hypothetical protein VN461_12325 [Vicinamibacteria bacterium]|jgi:hypothetical protein|nr:hypothetical protein [Vicinamibacteria bacterium]